MTIFTIFMYFYPQNLCVKIFTHKIDTNRHKQIHAYLFCLIKCQIDLLQNGPATYFITINQMYKMVSK